MSAQSFISKTKANITNKIIFGAAALGMVLLVGFTSAAAEQNTGNTEGTGYGPSISNTGPHSHNSITISNKTKVTKTVTNNVNVSNTNIQSSSSGNAKVEDNTTGGSAVSGSSANYYSNTTSIDITN